ncbi:SIR2 family protein [Dactylosporangium sp. AC04546]|uniref:SIR2 family protein n=1 Tax=Dactylosporangium sp. AC04546 TaxID=2862460 RepID=UPI001EDE82DB|nr:SIR2 family protein [Dactylosporangium sp. AC04546]WVK86212.1 SIR2 family protein [Dactylosporangium sp. AC04546]
MTLLDEIAGAIGHGAQITLILGAGLTQPAVPGLTGIVELADRYAAGLGDDGELTQALHQARQELGPQAAPIEVYLAYRRVFTARRSPGEFDVVAQQAVLAGYRAPDLATTPLATHGIWQRVDLRLGERVENSLDWWELPPGVRAVGRLLAWRPDEFGSGVVLTTNFDPLVEVAVRLTGRQAVSVPVDAAGRPDRRPEGDGTVQVFHLHGFWRPVNETDRSPMLHDPAPSVESAEPSEASRAIAELITGDQVVVVGYSGWDDVVTGALRAVRAVRPVRVLWALQEDAPPPDLAARLGDLVTFFPGIDADELFARLADRLQVPATVPRPDPRRRVRHLDWERELFSQPGNVVPDGVLPLLRQLERRYGWGVDWAGDPQPPRLLFWPVRLRGRASLINAVQALGAAALSERGVRVVVCLDDFGVTDRAELGAAFAADLRRWMRRVDPAAGPAVVSLHDYIEDSHREPSLLRPTDPWSVARIFYGERNPSLYSVLAAIKVVPHLALHDLEQNAAAIVQTLLSKDANRLLTPLTTWAYLHHLLETEPAAEVMAYAGSDERLLWEQFREHFGLGGTLLYNPYIRHLTNESRMVRWSTPAELREYLASTRELPGWGEEGGYVHWLVQNAFLLPRYLTRSPFPELGGYRLDSWVAFAAALDKGAPVLDLLAADVSAFYLPPTPPAP